MKTSSIALTKKEEKLLKFIEAYQMKHGASPTVREMREYMNLKSDGFIIHLMERLAAKRLIKKGNTPRSIGLLSSVAEKLHAKGVVRVPVLGHIPAGGPVISEEHIEEWISLGEDQIKNPGDCFMLRVRGNSMINVGILDGDYVIASTKMQPRERDIVVALVDGGSTVKRYMLERKGIVAGKPYLKPENSEHKNIYPESDLQVQGVVIGVFRWY